MEIVKIILTYNVYQNIEQLPSITADSPTDVEPHDNGKLPIPTWELALNIFSKKKILIHGMQKCLMMNILYNLM